MSACQELGVREGARGQGGGYKRATQGILLVMELLCILTVMVHTGTCTRDKTA